MKNLAAFYLVIFLPLVLLTIALIYLRGNYTVLTLFFIYVFIYRPIVCYFRLKQKKLVHKTDFFKFFLPLWLGKWTKELYKS